MNEYPKIISFLSDLRELGVELWVEEEQLMVDAPKGVIDSTLREELTLRKNDILAFLSSSARSLSPEIKPIERYSREERLPLSFSQMRQWFLEQLEPETAAYNIPFVRRLKGPLNVPVLEKCFGEIISRHESLRTLFKNEGGEPYQEIYPYRPFQLNMIDLRDIPEVQREAKALQLAGQEVGKGFDITTEQLIRVCLIRLKDEDHILAIVMHHIVSDGWSMRVLLNEITVLYDDISGGLAPRLPELPIQYSDYAYWQREFMTGKVLEDQLSYWKDKLRSSPSVIDLYTDYQRPPVQTYRGDYKDFSLSRDVSDGLRRFSRGEGSLFMVLLAALKVLLYRYTRQEDINIGTYIANRNRKEIEALIGFFVNTLVMRTDVSGNPTFSELFTRVRRTAIDAYAHQDLSFEILLDALKIERTMSHTPLFQVMFVFQNVAAHHLELPGVTIDSIDFGAKRAEFDLTLSMWEQNDILMGRLNYNSDLFRKYTIDRMIDHFRNLLHHITTDPDQPIAALPMLSVEERVQLESQWCQNNRASVPLSAGGTDCIHHLFEARARTDPDNIALICDSTQMTYKQLNERSNQLAHYLHRIGVLPDSCVGICIERSVDTIVGILAILKSGCAYLPMDPIYPKDRLEYMIADSQSAVVLTEKKLLTVFQDIDAKVVCVGDMAQEIAKEGKEDPLSGATPEHLAYIIYTSGSTGRPKGVLIEHRSLANFVEFARHEYELGPGQRVLQFASITFDASAEEIFPTLTSGATLVLRNEEMMASMPSFFQTISDWQISVLDLPTAFFHELIISLANDGITVPESLRLIIIGGEKAQVEYVELWQVHGNPSVRVLNTYGPTEATVVASFCDLTALLNRGFDGTEIPIGRPIDNTTAYILDPNRNVVPMGVPGELYIGGIGLAQGYMNLSEMTAASFIQHRFSDGADARLYKTGDLVRYRDDGDIEYLGRIDSQIKIRGYRIETQEIESVLKQHPSIGNSVVSTYKDKIGQARIAAYFTKIDEMNPAERDLRDFLKDRLPDYMIPSAFVNLDAIPLTSHGKIDFKALPLPETNSLAIGDGNALAEPQTPMECLIAQIWREILGIEHVGLHDKFFDLGGNSLLSMRVITRIKKETGFVINPREFIFQPLGQIAAICEGKTVDDTHPVLVQLEERDSFFFGQEQNRLFGCYHRPDRNHSRECNIVLCYPMDPEYIRAHRTFVQLAARLSSVGFPVLRFDFHGCGDSSGSFEETSIEQWMEDISTAIDEIRRRSQIEKVCLLGLRLGASLSMMAASNGNNVDGLILWNPIADGRQYIRELQVMHEETLKNTYTSKPGKNDSPKKEFLGYSFSNNMLSDIEGIDLLSVEQKPYNKMLFIRSGQMDDGEKMKTLLGTANPQMDYEEMPGPNVWLEDPYQEVVQQSVVQSAVSWLCEVYE